MAKHRTSQGLGIRPPKPNRMAQALGEVEQLLAAGASKSEAMRLTRARRAVVRRCRQEGTHYTPHAVAERCADCGALVCGDKCLACSLARRSL